MSANDGLNLIKISDVRITYNEIHRTIRSTATQIRDQFGPDIMIAIGGGGFFPARVLRTFLKTPTRKNIPIQAIGLSLYEELGTGLTNGLPSTEEKVGKEVVRLDFSTLGHTPLLGRRILIVDEVDDTRTTLSYAVAELEKDVQVQLEKLSLDERKKLPLTEFAIFVVHNKDKPKSAQIPDHVKYFAGKTIGDQWIDYPWEATDIDEHERLAKSSTQPLSEVVV
ncbi:phosphoribosyltransferase-like protein [Melampsora americana]|nr:phosphoribosyltransferase-like protein [Melampsora americana]